MAIKQILFNTEMVRAILDGRKTCTRRLVKLPSYIKRQEDGLYTLYAESTCYENQHLEKIINYIKPPYQLGDILYVRETWSEWTDGYLYKAWNSPFPQAGESAMMKWHPSIHMPKEAARIWLKVTNVSVERLQDITEDGAKAEGAKQCYEQINTIEDKPVTYLAEDDKGYYVLGFKSVWNSTIKKSDLNRYGWDANPWVWVIEFERCEKPKGV